ncbi:hypothetical protein [Streptomyces sp. CB02923]|uniref:hypothetical protein n=1 Tax=Streptomyces sp. CB02923 TaxID=1718985 RepID=UPI00190273EB|nr:hypothetical protein [Streptomyces sp. CB02923]
MLLLDLIILLSGILIGTVAHLSVPVAIAAGAAISTVLLAFATREHRMKRYRR